MGNFLTPLVRKEPATSDGRTCMSVGQKMSRRRRPPSALQPKDDGHCPFPPLYFRKKTAASMFSQNCCHFEHVCLCHVFKHKTFMSLKASSVRGKNPILQIPASHYCGIFRHVWRTVFPNLVSASKLYDANARRGNISIKARAAVTSVCVYLQ